MSKELVIASNRHETKVAILEDDQLVEVYFQRSNEYSLAGSIHKGRVTRVLPGMQSAFVDLGLERDTFLYVSDFFEEHEDIDTVAEDRGPGRRDRGTDRGDRGADRPDRGSDRGPRADRPALRSLPIELPVTVEEQPPIAPIETAASVEPFTGGPELVPPSSSSESESSEPRPDSNGDRDRGRRGRRSRRRRSRGRGFPENKYAQPGTVDAPVAATEPEGEEDEAEEDAVPQDVMILPGESLAKYRQITPPSASSPVSALPAEEPGPGEPVGDEEIADIEERADELETADKILAHHDGPPEAVEQKIEEVKNDQPASEFVVGDIESEEEESAVESEAGHVPEGAEFRQRSPVVPFRMDGAEAEELASELAAELEASSEVPDSEGLSAAEFAEDEIAGEEPDSGSSEFEGADLEDAGTASEMSEGPVPLDESGTGPQSASVRDPGGRYMHRVSRRMRRRRGGNRFGQQPQNERPGQLPVTQFETAASGAAPAPLMQAESRRESGDKPERVMPSISDLLKSGQEIIVQIAKEPLGQKGARITSHIALPGRYVVFMPSVSHLGVSRKVESEEERQRLKRILQAHRVGTTGGFIVRTAGEGVPEAEIAADMDFLYKLWLDIRQKAEKKPAPMLLHCDLDVVQRILRDQVSEDYKSIWVDNEDMYESVLSFVQRFQPALVGRVKMYTREAPIFDAFSITQELEKALRPKVWLKSGGYIVINQTEALVAIDINTGKYVGKSNRLEDTIVKTNLEAVKEIVRQIRLRDLGGIIVVDFIDMDERKNRQKVMQALEEAMQTDKAPYKVLQFNDFGLVAITRKRVKQSLERTLCAPCPYCEGAGYVKSVQTIIGEILAEAQKIRKALDRGDVMLRVHPEVARVLKANDNKYLEELEETLGRPVLVKGDPALHHEKFDLG